MKDAQKPIKLVYRPSLGYLREGRFVIPDLQGEFEWKPRHICGQMRPNTRKYPARRGDGGSPVSRRMVRNPISRRLEDYAKPSAAPILLVSLQILPDRGLR